MKKLKLNYLLVFAVVVTMFGITGCQQDKQEEQYRTDVLRSNWKLQKDAELNGVTGDVISKKDYKADGWLNAVVPGTVMGSLVADGVIKDPYFGINLKKVDKKQFEKPWWYRTTFKLSSEDIKRTVTLRFRGVNYRADLWINRKQVADKDKLAGTFNMFTFKINDYVGKGENVIALKLWAPVDGEYSIGFVDWNPFPPDRNMGIFRDVILEVTGGVKIRSPFVESKVDLKSLNAADLTVRAELENNSDKPVSGTVKVNYELGQVEKQVTVKAGETVSCEFTPDEFPQLKVKNVKLWWPNGMGDPNLYNVSVEFVADNKVVDKVNDKYGIREVESYFDKDGNRAFKVNGEFVLITGGGWVDDLLLQDTPESVSAQLKYVKQMNLNSIRLEGFWGKDDVLYDLCDEYGILIMVGWSCHWEWEEYLGKPVHGKYMAYNNPEDIALLTEYWKSQLLWLRNHPSIYVWMTGSDKLPDPQLEKNYIKLFDKYDDSRPYVTSAGGVGSDQGIIGDEVLYSEISGPTGMKMLGPYAYTPPVYWFTDTKLGGAYGFNTETCPGPNISPVSSLRKMIPEDHLWPIDKVYWEFHCGRNQFQTLDRYRKAMNARYGKSNNVEEFAFKSQLMNYELMRPMFEAFVAHKPKSTGLIQWMLNSAWPEMYWQLYDSYLEPNGAFYATRKANNMVHAIYRYGFDDIYLANSNLKGTSDLKVSIKAYDINSKEVFSHEWEGNIDGNSSKPIFELPKNLKKSPVWFLDLRVYNSDNIEIDNNFYWLSVKADKLDYEAAAKLEWAFYTPPKAYADFSALNNLPQVKPDYLYEYSKDGDYGKVKLTIKNNSNSIAFFIFMDIVDPATGEPILPIFWDDNYVSLLPGEERVYNAEFLLKDFNKKPQIIVKGYNVAPQSID